MQKVCLYRAEQNAVILVAANPASSSTQDGHIFDRDEKKKGDSSATNKTESSADGQTLGDVTHRPR